MEWEEIKGYHTTVYKKWTKNRGMSGEENMMKIEWE
jgi:hypothetical protein